MTYTYGQTIAKGTRIHGLAWTATSSPPKTIELVDSAGKVVWTGTEGGSWSSLTGWVVPDDLTVRIVAR